MNMNKIIMDKDRLKLNNISGYFKIEVNKNGTLDVINLEDIVKLEINVPKNTNFTVNLFNKDKLELNIKVTLDDNSSFTLNHTFKIVNEIKENIDVLLAGNNILCNINIRGKNEETGKVSINLNGTVAGETHDNVINEYAKIINKSINSNVLIPNLIVNTNEVIANHGVSVGGVPRKQVTYLVQKGIKKENAEKQVETGFLLSIMPDYIKEEIKKILN